MSDSAQRYEAMLESVPCNLCGADDYEVVYPARYEEAQPDDVINNFRSSGDEILVDQLVRCRNCGLQYLTPRLKSDVVITGYSEGTDEAFISQNAARERTFTKNLDLIERLVPQQGRILDIGTAGGAFLGVAKQRGWETAGCEPNRWLAEWGSQHYGITIQPGTIYDMQLPDNAFDVVTLWDVLEHTPDPKSVLLECRRVLKTVTDKPELSNVMKSFLLLLFDKGRIGFLSSINQFYGKLADELKGIARASLVSATELSAETVEKIRQTLSQKTGKEVVLDIEQDPGLIGGIVTKIGDLVLDGSIRTQLNNMRESLKRGERV